jgi:hypothetical protein
MVAAMTRDERLDRIDELKASNDKLRAEREERERARELDPFAYDDHLRAERSAEPERDACVQQNDAAGILYREFDGNALYDAPQPDWSAWESWMKGHLANERAEVLELLTEGMAEFVTKYVGGKLVERDREIGVLRNENVEIRALLGSVLSKVEANNEKMKNLIADLEGERRERHELELKLADLRGRMGALLRDYVA